MIDLRPPGAVRWICRELEKAGYETWAVGGAVRDALAGRPSGDWDLASAASPNRVRRIFRRTVPIGIDHGTVGVIAGDGVMYEVTTFRRDVETTGRHAVVAFADTVDEDLARRDFTINAVAWHPLRKVLYDPYGGAADLKQGILQTVGEPEERFAEDYLRVLRALRFAGTFRLQVECATWRALVGAVARLDVLSPERVREEMEKILTGREPPSAALALYAASGALAHRYPELDRQVGWSQEGRGGDLWSHALRTVDLLSPHRPALRWVALLAGAGEPEDGGPEDGEPAAHSPGRRGLLGAAALLERLRSSNARIQQVAGLVEFVRRPPGAGAPDADLRRWLSQVGRERLPDLIRIWIAELRSDELVGDGGEGAWERGKLERLVRRLRATARAPVALTTDELAFSGRDLIQMGYRPGPRFGELLRALLDRVLDDPTLNDRETLAAEAEAWMAARDEEVR